MNRTRYPWLHQCSSKAGLMGSQQG